jgi:hypothetical protein
VFSFRLVTSHCYLEFQSLEHSGFRIFGLGLFNLYCFQSQLMA